MKPSDGGTEGGLESRVDRLEALIGSLEARLAALEGRAPVPGAVPTPRPTRAARIREVESAAPPEAMKSREGGVSGYLALAGLAFLLFGGAFFLRAITDTGAIPRSLGVGIGVAYAILWLVVAVRARTAAVATAFTLASSAIFFPLLVESTLRMKTLPPAGSALLLLGVAPLYLGVAWRRVLLPLAWIQTMLALLVGAGLMFSTGAFEAFSVVYIAFGAGMLWLTYGRRWQVLRWPTALAADWSVVVITVFLSLPADSSKDFPAPSVRGVLLIDMLLVGAFLGSFCIRLLLRRRSPRLFEILQSCAVLLLGFGGGVQAAWSAGVGILPIGAGAMVAGLLCYGLALAFSEAIARERPNTLLFTSVALIFTLVGGPMVLSRPGLGLAFSGLGILATALGLRARREAFSAHGGLLLLAGTLMSGSLGSLFSPAALAFRDAGLQPLLILLSLGGVYALHVLHRDPRTLAWYRWIPASVVGTLAILGIGEILLAALGGLVPALGRDPAALTALRTTLLAALAVAFAGVARTVPRLGFRWLVHPLLGVAGAQLLLQAFPHGRPITLFLAFSCFGGALALAPRLIRVPVQEPAA